MPEQSFDARVATLDAQVQILLRDLGNLDKLFPSIRDQADIEQKVAILETEVEIIKLKMDKKVDTNEFVPVRLIVFGMTGIILVSVLCTLLYIIGLKNK